MKDAETKLEMIKNISEQLKAAVENEIERKKKEHYALEALRAHEGLLREARANSVSRRKIAVILNECGIEASVETITKFCTEVLGEMIKTRAPRRKKKKPKSDKRTVTQHLVKPVSRPLGRDTPKPTPIPIRDTKPGFRVAKDDL